MIIWGSRGITSTVENSEFHCPRCATKRSSRLRQVRRFFTLYFIPIIPLDITGRFVECDSCGGTFSEEMLKYDPALEEQKFYTKMLRVMIMAALADGKVDEQEWAVIQEQYSELTGFPVPEETLENEIRMGSEARTNLNRFVAGFAGELTSQNKALIVRLVFRTMNASGHLQASHEQQLASLASTLQVPEDQYRAFIGRLRESNDS